VSDARRLAETYGIRIEFADLGDWGDATLVAEYEPGTIPIIRVNTRLPDTPRRVDLAIAHEVYHHREAIGEIPRLVNRRAREAAADAFAHDFLRSGAA